MFKPTFQAWKGYYGNVYFSPISVQSAPAAPHPHPPAPDIDRCSEKLQEILIRSNTPSRRSRSVTSKRTTTSSAVSTVSNPRSSASSKRALVKRSQSMISVKSKTSALSRASAGSRQMSLLDKRSVMSNLNENFTEDVAWIQGLESIGSLNVMRNDVITIDQRRSNTHGFDRERLRKGSALKQRAQTAKPATRVCHAELEVHGGQCDRPTNQSQAVVRARSRIPFHAINRYFPKAPHNSGVFNSQSHSSCLGSFDSLPPLEQLRASLRKFNPSSSTSKDELMSLVPTSQRQSLTADYKRMPFVKFSPEFRPPRPPSHTISVQ